MTIRGDHRKRSSAVQAGEGGMGCVYTVRPARSTSRYHQALKAHLSTNEELKNRFVPGRRGVAEHPGIAGCRLLGMPGGSASSHGVRRGENLSI